MPHPIPMEDVIDVLIIYLAKRQMQGRPTTLRQMSKRIGLGAPVLKAELEKNAVQYILIPHGERDWVTSSTEIAIVSLPEKLASRNGLSLEKIEESFQKYFGKHGLEPIDLDDQLTVGDRVLDMDPYAPYRITTDQYRALKSQLISYPQLIQEARERGYSGRAVERAVGGNRLRYGLASELWRPYVFRNHRYYLREVLNYLAESYTTYLMDSTAEKKKNQREGKTGEKDDYKTKRRAVTRPAKGNPGNRRSKRNRPAKNSVLNR